MLVVNFREASHHCMLSYPYSNYPTLIDTTMIWFSFVMVERSSTIG